MKEIKLLVSEINSLTSKNYIVDYNSAYGGYRLISIPFESYIFGKSSMCERLSKKEFKQYLLGIIAGLKF